MIYIIPTIREPYENQIEYCIDHNLIKFIKKNFKSDFKIITEKETIKKNTNLFIFSGGNNIISLSKKKKDIFRNSLDSFYFEQSIKKNIPILGICHGAQFIAKKFKSLIEPVKNHVGKHFIFLNNKKKYLVNSYHNFGITKLGESLSKIAIASDGTIEAFKHERLRILGVMWHPERSKKINKLDKKIFKI